MDLAASIQAVTEEVDAAADARARAARPGSENLCLAGGVALNCVANGKVLRDGAVRATSGSSRRRAMPAARSARRSPPTTCSRTSRAQLERRARRHAAAPISARPSTQDEIERRLDAASARVFERAPTTTHDRRAPRTRSPTARRSAGSRAAWSSGRARSAPARSSAIARSPTMQTTLNLKVKYREIFRPFAPSVLREDVADWFELDDDSPYMLLVADVVERRRRADDRGRAGAVRHRQAQRAALGHPGGDPRRLLGAHPDRARRHQPALPRAARARSSADRLPGAGQHQLQRARRADRVHARGRLPLLHGHRDRRAGRSATACCARSSRTRP